MGNKFNDNPNRIHLWNDDITYTTYRVNFSNNGNCRKNKGVPMGGDGGSARVEMPIFSIDSGSVAKGTKVAITCATVGATIYYTTDGSTPTKESNVYSEEITINSDVTITAYATKDEMTSSQIAQESYTVVVAKVSKPVISNDKGTVSISCATSGATIYYTKDGSTPTTSSDVYGTPFTVTNGSKVMALAVKEEMTNSDIAEKTISWTSKSVLYVGLVKCDTESATSETATESFMTVENVSALTQVESSTVAIGEKSFTWPETDVYDIVFAYPKAMTALKSIKDEMGNETITGSWNTKELAIDGIDYTVYFCKTATDSDEGDTYKYTFA